MGETMADYNKEINASLGKLEDGDVMSGKVENEEQAASSLTWDHLKELRDSKETLTIKVNGMVNGGLITNVEDIRGFIPASQISLDYVENLDEWLNKTMEVRVITVDKSKKKLVLSAKAILKENADKEKAKKLSELKVGTITEGVVETLQPYGAFVNIGDGITGLLHVSQISDKRIKEPSEVLKEGQTVKVKITKVEDKRISLSMKALSDDSSKAPREEFEKIDLPKAAAPTTSLGDLLKNIKL